MLDIKRKTPLIALVGALALMASHAASVREYWCMLKVRSDATLLDQYSAGIAGVSACAGKQASKKY